MSRATLGLPFPALVSEAFEALADNRLRSALSLLGIAIGIASIIVVSSIALSGREMVFKELQTFGLKTFWIFRSFASDEKLERDVVGSGVTTTDYKDLTRRALPAVARLSPVVEIATEKVAAAKGGRSIRVRLQGVGSDYDRINGDEVVAGRFLTQDDVVGRLNVAVIAAGVVEKLFPQEAGSAVGQRFSLGEHWFVVIGVLGEKSRDLIASLGAGRSEETSARIVIPYTTRQMMLGDREFVSYLQGEAHELDGAEAATQSIVDVLSVRHRNAFLYRSERMSSYVATANRILGWVAVIGVAGAIVSLLVGGLAIMNIMSTSVIERTKEIGVRRAIGATKATIRAQFLMEAVLISVIGGAIGVVLGTVLIKLMSALSVLVIHVSLNGLLLALISTFAVGILSGYYPALTASRLAPVEALRHE